MSGNLGKWFYLPVFFLVAIGIQTQDLHRMSFLPPQIYLQLKINFVSQSVINILSKTAAF